MTHQNYYQTQDEAGLAEDMREIAKDGPVRTMGCKGWSDRREFGALAVSSSVRALDYLKTVPGDWVKTKDISAAVGVGTSTLSTVLSNMAKEGEIETELRRTPKNSKYRIWRYVEAGMTPDERRDYVILMAEGGYTHEEALAIIQRPKVKMRAYKGDGQ